MDPWLIIPKAALAAKNHFCLPPPVRRRYLCAKKHFFGHFFVLFGHFWSFLVIFAKKNRIITLFEPFPPFLY